MKKYLPLLFFLLVPFNFVLANPDAEYYHETTNWDIITLAVYLFAIAFVFEWPVFYLFFRKKVSNIKLTIGVFVANLISVSAMFVIVFSYIFNFLSELSIFYNNDLLFLLFFELIVLAVEFYFYYFYFKKLFKNNLIAEKIKKLKLFLVIFLANVSSLFFGYLVLYFFNNLQF